jgi:hypothetical protein
MKFAAGTTSSLTPRRINLNVPAALGDRRMSHSGGGEFVTDESERERVGPDTELGVVNSLKDGCEVNGGQR